MKPCRCTTLVCSHRMGGYDAWAVDRLVPDPVAVLSPDVARMDYVAWCSESWFKPYPRSKQRAAVKAVGAVVKGRGRELRYLGVRVVGPAVKDSGYRATTFTVPSDEPGDMEAAGVALFAAGLVTDTRALDMAVVALGQARGRLCGVCGRVTRRVEQVHVRCAP